jgi:hypothetical protein
VRRNAAGGIQALPVDQGKRLRTFELQDVKSGAPCVVLALLLLFVRGPRRQARAGGAIALPARPLARQLLPSALLEPSVPLAKDAGEINAERKGRVRFQGETIQSQLFDQPILQSLVRPLDPTLRLARIGADDIDIQSMQRAPELGHPVAAHSTGLVDAKHPMLVAVESNQARRDGTSRRVVRSGDHGVVLAGHAL